MTTAARVYRQTVLLILVVAAVLVAAVFTIGSVSPAGAAAEHSDTTRYTYDAPGELAEVRIVGSGGAVARVVRIDRSAFRYPGETQLVYDPARNLVDPQPATMDSFTWNGSTVRHSPTATAIGDDLNTGTNFRRSQGSAGHDVIVHGQVIDGQAQFVTNGLPTHPQQIADAVLSNPSYVPGSPVQLVTCHGACGLADELSDALRGAPVRAVPGRVDIDPVTGLLREWK